MSRAHILQHQTGFDWVALYYKLFIDNEWSCRVASAQIGSAGARPSGDTKATFKRKTPRARPARGKNSKLAQPCVRTAQADTQAHLRTGRNCARDTHKWATRSSAVTAAANDIQQVLNPADADAAESSDDSAAVVVHAKDEGADEAATAHAVATAPTQAPTRGGMCAAAGHEAPQKGAAQDVACEGVAVPASMPTMSAAAPDDAATTGKAAVVASTDQHEGEGGIALATPSLAAECAAAANCGAGSAATAAIAAATAAVAYYSRTEQGAGGTAAACRSGADEEDGSCVEVPDHVQAAIRFWLECAPLARTFSDCHTHASARALSRKQRYVRDQS